LKKAENFNFTGQTDHCRKHAEHYNFYNIKSENFRKHSSAVPEMCSKAHPCSTLLCQTWKPTEFNLQLLSIVST